VGDGGIEGQVLPLRREGRDVLEEDAARRLGTPAALCDGRHVVVRRDYLTAAEGDDLAAILAHQLAPLLLVDERLLRDLAADLVRPLRTLAVHGERLPHPLDAVPNDLDLFGRIRPKTRRL